MSNSRGFHRGGRSNQGRSFAGRGHASRDQGSSKSNDILDFKLGEKSNAVKLTKWLFKIRDKIGTKYSKYGLNNIVTRDGIIGAYSPPEEPEDPDEEASDIEKQKWKSMFNMYLNQREEFKSMKLACVADIYESIGTQSRFRLTEQNNKLSEASRFDMDDPISVLKLSVSTHLTDSNIDDGVNLMSAEISFVNIRMYPDELLPNYLQRYNILMSTYSNLLIESGLDIDGVANRIGNAKSRALRFIMGLDSHRFQNHLNKYTVRDLEYPATLELAYEQAATFAQAKVAGGNSLNRKGIFLTYPIGDESKSHERFGDSESSKKKCYRCGAVGHIKIDCNNVLPNKDGGGHKNDQVNNKNNNKNKNKSDKKSGGKGDDPN